MKKKRSLTGRISRFFLKLFLSLVALSVLWVVILKWVPVWYTPLMAVRSFEYSGDKSFHTRKDWVSYKKISPEAARAVIASEDNLFFEHAGFDWEAVKKAVDDHKRGKRLRGASTISQQTAKNVFLFPGRNWFRKGMEAYFTVLIEKIWGKHRILEVYLNVAEMGKGIYGVEAASMTFYGHHASKLSRREACLIAACLPNPIKRNAGSPSSYVSGRASRIEGMEAKLLYPAWVYHREEPKAAKPKASSKTAKGSKSAKKPSKGCKK